MTEREIPEEVRRSIVAELKEHAIRDERLAHELAPQDGNGANELLAYADSYRLAARAITGEYAVSLIRERAWCYMQEHGDDKVHHYLQTWANELEASIQKDGADG